MTRINIDGIPSLIWGEKSDKVFIAVHGKMSSKENFTHFASIAESKGYQVLSFDLPEHGERKKQAYACNPWNGVHDLQLIMNFAKHNWPELNLYAESLGAYFSLLAYQKEPLQKCLFLSPVLNMVHLIENMMNWTGVDTAKLQVQKEIPTSFGETLSWEYYNFARQNEIRHWGAPTAILCGSKDNLTDRKTVEANCFRYKCNK
ncbi:hypothetical protein SAMN05660649_04198 [Desulfotomaculum arcticum]|uniref:Serine aminopeptidase S33 domain-containing protein n=1 Tax=Desulfotruncus arcticus DSM 17038 TaxID=1121424 RepID=A0A1I2Y2N7_9FIRM|nr:alpha/beta hydrolase [Desulfotruncus arcticus]SFH18591.1 hypothetical protein SAMN05660649_04198 [Desulfotomaculum arcticum] [Desulfotruncus arcticus DSM 17038]